MSDPKHAKVAAAEALRDLLTIFNRDLGHQVAPIDFFPVIDAIANYTLQLVRIERQVPPFRMKDLTLTAELTPPTPAHDIDADPFTPTPQNPKDPPGD